MKNTIQVNSIRELDYSNYGVINPKGHNNQTLFKSDLQNYIIENYAEDFEEEKEMKLRTYWSSIDIEYLTFYDAINFIKARENLEYITLEETMAKIKKYTLENTREFIFESFAAKKRLTELSGEFEIVWKEINKYLLPNNLTEEEIEEIKAAVKKIQFYWKEDIYEYFEGEIDFEFGEDLKKDFPHLNGELTKKNNAIVYMPDWKFDYVDDIFKIQNRLYKRYNRIND